MTDQPERPRYGKWFPQGAVEVPLVFHPDPGDPFAFVGARADTEGPIAFTPGDSFEVDAIGPGQSVRFRMMLRRGYPQSPPPPPLSELADELSEQEPDDEEPPAS